MQTDAPLQNFVGSIVTRPGEGKHARYTHFNGHKCMMGGRAVEKKRGNCEGGFCRLKVPHFLSHPSIQPLLPVSHCTGLFLHWPHTHHDLRACWCSDSESLGSACATSCAIGHLRCFCSFHFSLYVILQHIRIRLLSKDCNVSTGPAEGGGCGGGRRVGAILPDVRPPHRPHHQGPGSCRRSRPPSAWQVIVSTPAHHWCCESPSHQPGQWFV